MYNHLLYFSYWLGNSAVLYLFGLVLPTYIRLGNWRFSPIESAVYAGFWITFFVWVLWDFALAKGVKFDSGAVILGYFWCANVFAIWLISRFSQVAGFGIASYLWAFAIATLAFIIQRFAFRLVAGKKAL
jgi:hypothetical protein